MNIKHLMKTALGVLVSLVPAPAFAQTCVELTNYGRQQVLINTCPYAVTLVHCGLRPTGNSGLDCNRNHLGTGGVRSGGMVTVGDALGSYGRVYWFECLGGKTPSRTRWTGNQIEGECPR